MQRKALLILVLAILAVDPAGAQLDLFTNPSGTVLFDLRPDSEDKNIEGTPYLNDEFVKSTIKVKDGTVYEDVSLRYNIMNDEIEFLGEDGMAWAMRSRDLTQWAIIGRDTIVTREAVISGKPGLKHFILLADGKAQLLLKKVKRYRAGTEPKPFQEGTKPSYVDAGEEYYLSFEGEDMALEVPKKKELAEFFGENGTRVATFVKKEKLSLKKQEDLLDLVNFFNSL